MIKVLYINHVSIMAGSSKSLFEILKSLPDSKIKKHVICPKGQFSKHLKSKNIPYLTSLGVCQFNNTKYSFYKKLRWLILIREIFVIPFFLISIIKAKVRWKNFDIIHLNEITMIPCVYILRLFFKNSKIISSVRSIQRSKKNKRYKILENIYFKYIDLFICIDQNVYNSVSNNLNKICIHNIFSSEKKNSSKKSKRSKMTVGIVGLIQKSKGADIFFKAAKLCIDFGYDIDFHYYGDVNLRTKTIRHKVRKFFNMHEDISLELKKLTSIHKMNENIKFFEFNEELNKIYSSIDILCFPSLLDAPGRPVFEAGFFNVPSIVAISNPLKDTFIDKVTGLIVKEKDHLDLAEKIIYLSKNTKLLKEFGKNAYLLSYKNFSSEVNSQKFIKAYKKILKK